MYNISYSNLVIQKDIPRLSKPVRAIIKKTIETKLLLDPIKFGKPLQYSLKGCRSLRVGDYRIIYQLLGHDIRVLFIRHRRDCYKA